MIHIPDIPESGKVVNASTKTDTWFKKLITDAIGKTAELNEATIRIQVKRVENSLDVSGSIHLDLIGECDRCLKRYGFAEDIPVKMLLVQRPTGKGVEFEPGDDAEDLNEILDFSYFDGLEVDIGDIIRQHIVMAQPMTHLCNENCQGLCAKCGKDLNEGPCNCTDSEKESPFAVLKKYKIN